MGLKYIVVVWDALTKTKLLYMYIVMDTVIYEFIGFTKISCYKNSLLLVMTIADSIETYQVYNTIHSSYTETRSETTNPSPDFDRTKLGLKVIRGGRY